VLSFKNRLKKEKDIRKVLKSRNKFSDGKTLVLKAEKNNLDCLRFAFTIGKKVSKKATVRNRIKRELSEISRKEIPQMKKGWDIIFIVLSGIQGKTSKEIKESLINLFKKAGLLK
jgi:ribonuclease P protein component